MGQDKKNKKAIIVTGYSCNNNCLFCNIRHAARSFNREYSDIIHDLKKEYASDCRSVEFIGGEVTIRNDIIALVANARSLGYKYISFETNGRMFANKEFTKSIIEAGLTHVLFSIHGHKAEIHDRLTQSPGSYQQAMEGMGQVLSF